MPIPIYRKMQTIWVCQLCTKLRGRVGRSNRIVTPIFMYRPEKINSEESEKLHFRSD